MGFKLAIERDGNRMYVNPDIDITKIRDSMQLDSGTVIAEMETPDAFVSLEVQGDVCVYFHTEDAPQGFDGPYTKPSSFPDELKALIAGEEPVRGAENWLYDRRVCVYANNWFELFIGKDKNDLCSKSFLVNIDNMTNEGLYETMMEFVHLVWPRIKPSCDTNHA